MHEYSQSIYCHLEATDDSFLTLFIDVRLFKCSLAKRAVNKTIHKSIPLN